MSNAKETATVSVPVSESVDAKVTPGGGARKMLLEASKPTALVCRPCGYVLAVVNAGAKDPELPETCPGKTKDSEGKDAVCGNATADHVARMDATTVEVDETKHAIRGTELPASHDDQIAAAEAHVEELKKRKAAAPPA